MKKGEAIMKENKLLKAIINSKKKYPVSVSVTYREKEEYLSIDYEELYSYILSLSSYLKSLKVKKFAIIGNNKLEYLVSMLSILCNIGDVILIDKELNEEDILNIFKKYNPEAIILDEDINLSFKDYKVINFNKINEEMKKKNDFKINLKFIGNLILHTSGTTGEPKCIKLSCENYFSVIPELNRKWKVVNGQSCLLIIPLYHIYAITSLFHGLYAGINNILEWDYKRLNNVLSITKPYLFMGVPLMYNKVKDTVLSKSGKKVKTAIAISNILLKLKIDIRKKLFKEIHNYFGGNYVFGCSAGSLLPYETSKFFNDIGLPIYNVYGMTETSGPVAISYKNHNLYDSVGEILDINKVKIINQDESGVGEVLIKGKNVFAGYINENSKKCFENDYYNTGDIGYIKDNYLYIIGRKKNILIGDNGKNISPEEIIKKILKNKMIHDCNVIMKNNKLIAIVNTELTPEEMQKYIDEVNKKLPKYKNISDFEITTKKIK